MLKEQVKSLRNAVNWRVTQIKYLIEHIDYAVQHGNVDLAFKKIEEAHDKLNKLCFTVNSLIRDMHIQLEVKREQISRLSMR